MCKCLSIVSRFFVGILSLLFAILGFVLLVFGILVKVNASVINNQFQPLLDSVSAQASAATGGTVALPTENLNIVDLVGGLAIAFIVIGIIMLIIGVFGVAGACCMVKCMIILYLVVVTIFLLSQIVFIIIASVNRPIISDPPKPGLKTTLQQEYQGINGTNAATLLWNVIMNGLQCCGIDGSADFTNAALWQSQWGITSGRTPPFLAPAACCKSGLLTSADRTCAENPTVLNSNINVGCYDKVWDFIFTGTPFIIFVCADVGGFALLTFFAAVILYDIVQKNKSAGIV